MSSYFISTSKLRSSSSTLWYSDTTLMMGLINPTTTSWDAYNKLFSLLNSGLAIKNSATFNLLLVATSSIVSPSCTT